MNCYVSCLRGSNHKENRLLTDLVVYRTFFLLFHLRLFILIYKRLHVTDEDITSSDMLLQVHRTNCKSALAYIHIHKRKDNKMVPSGNKQF